MQNAKIVPLKADGESDLLRPTSSLENEVGILQPQVTRLRSFIAKMESILLNALPRAARQLRTAERDQTQQELVPIENRLRFVESILRNRWATNYELASWVQSKGDVEL